MEILGDFQTSVRKALSELDSNWADLDGLVVCGSHSREGHEKIIESIRDARTAGRPALLICYGHQLGAIEFARNMLGKTDATSEEFGGRGYKAVVRRQQPLVGLHNGESYWSYYEVEPSLLNEWHMPDNWIAVPYHPEYESSYWKPHPLLAKFIELCQR